MDISTASRLIRSVALVPVVALVSVASIALLMRLIDCDTDAIQQTVLPVFIDTIRYGGVLMLLGEAVVYVLRAWNIARLSQIAIEAQALEMLDATDDSSDSNDPTYH